MTRTYEFKAVVIIAVEESSHIHARAAARRLADLVAEGLPTGARLVRKNDEIEVRDRRAELDEMAREAGSANYGEFLDEVG